MKWAIYASLAAVYVGVNWITDPSHFNKTMEQTAAFSVVAWFISAFYREYQQNQERRHQEILSALRRIHTVMS